MVYTDLLLTTGLSVDMLDAFVEAQLRRYGSAATTDLNEFFEVRFNKSMESESPEYPIDYCLSSEDMKTVQLLFPEFRLQFREKLFDADGCFQVFYDVLFEDLRRINGKFRVLNFTGLFEKTIKKSFHNTHYCVPVYDVYSEERYRSQLINLRNLLKLPCYLSEIGEKDYLRAVFKSLKTEKKIVCSNPASCCAEGTVGIFDHILNDIPLEQVAVMSHTRRFNIAYGCFLFKPDMLYRDEGVFQDFNGRYVIDRKKDTLTMMFGAGSTRFSVVRWSSILRFASMSAVRIGNISFTLEIFRTKGDFYCYKMVNCGPSVEGSVSVMTRALWERTVDPVYLVTSYRLKSDFHDPRSETSYVEYKFYVKKSLFDKCLIFANDIDRRSTLTREDIYSFARVSESKLIVNGIECVRQNSLSATELYHLSVVVFMQAYQMRFDESLVEGRLKENLQYLDSAVRETGLLYTFTVKLAYIALSKIADPLHTVMQWCSSKANGILKDACESKVMLSSFTLQPRFQLYRTIIDCGKFVKPSYKVAAGFNDSYGFRNVYISIVKNVEQRREVLKKGYQSESDEDDVDYDDAISDITDDYVGDDADDDVDDVACDGKGISYQHVEVNDEETDSSDDEDEDYIEMNPAIATVLQEHGVCVDGDVITGIDDTIRCDERESDTGYSPLNTFFRKGSKLTNVLTEVLNKEKVSTVVCLADRTYRRVYEFLRLKKRIGIKVVQFPCDLRNYGNVVFLSSDFGFFGNETIDSLYRGIISSGKYIFVERDLRKQCLFSDAARFVHKRIQHQNFARITDRVSTTMTELQELEPDFVIGSKLLRPRTVDNPGAMAADIYRRIFPGEPVDSGYNRRLANESDTNLSLDTLGMTIATAKFGPEKPFSCFESSVFTNKQPPKLQGQKEALHSVGARNCNAWFSAETQSLDMICREVIGKTEKYFFHDGAKALLEYFAMNPVYLNDVNTAMWVEKLTSEKMMRLIPREFRKRLDDLQGFGMIVARDYLMNCYENFRDLEVGLSKFLQEDAKLCFEDVMNHYGTDFMFSRQSEQSVIAATRSLARHQMILKAEGKTVTDGSSYYKIPYTQVVVYNEIESNAYWSPVFIEIRERYLSLFKDNVLVNMKKDRRQIQDFLNKKEVFGRNVNYIENDFSKYDKSQREMCMVLEWFLYELLGLNVDDLNHWIDGNKRGKFLSFEMGVACHINFQRLSGSVVTAFGNTAVCIFFFAYISDKIKIFYYALFLGDDCLMCTEIVIDDLDISITGVAIFNLNTTTVQSNYGYFCSAFIVKTKDAVYFMSDPIKRYEKLGGYTATSEEKVEAMYESFCDLLFNYDNIAALEELDRCVQARYCLDFSIMPMLLALNTWAKRKDLFMSIWGKMKTYH